MEMSEKAKEVVAMYRNNGNKRQWGEINSMSKEELQEYYAHCNNEIQRLFLLTVEEIHAINDFPITEFTSITEDIVFLHSQAIVALKLINGIKLDESDQELIVE